MPQANPIVLTTTAGALTFNADSISNTHVVFQNVAQGSLAKREVLHFDRPLDEKTVIRRAIRVNVPLERTADGKTTMKMCTFKGEFVGPVDMSNTERAHLTELAVEALSNSEVQKVWNTPEWMF